MKRILAIVFFVSLVSGSYASLRDVRTLPNNDKNLVSVYNDTIKIVDFKQFEAYLHKKDGKVYVINFWATWCEPCVEELPGFEKLLTDYKKGRVEVILVSLDFPKMIETHLVPFIEKNNLKAQVIVLNDPKQNEWIPKVDQNWSGAIPATVIYSNEKRMFYEQTLTYNELKNSIEHFLN